MPAKKSPPKKRAAPKRNSKRTTPPPPPSPSPPENLRIEVPIELIFEILERDYPRELENAVLKAQLQILQEKK